MPPQGNWRSAQAQVPLRQSQRRATHSLETEQVAPAGPQAWPAMLKGQPPGSPDMAALASAVGPGAPLPGAPPPRAPPVAVIPTPPVPVGPEATPPQPPTTGGAEPPVPSEEPSPLP
jgi:hypothetical protein